ncbi:MAG: hypothetical protein VZR00_08950 [Lachnospiraceae bacterium]|nr:hypothetical protein [Lachnospiraceae bacterium]
MGEGGDSRGKEVMNRQGPNFSAWQIRRDGMIMGAIETFADLNYAPDYIKNWIIKRFDMTSEEAEDAMKKYYPQL